MNNKTMVFELRKRIFEEWRYKRLTWREIKEKYGFSKKWFYKYRNRLLAHGDEGLRDKARDNSNRPHRISLEQRLRILDYVYNNPTHGPLRIANEQMPRISSKAVWNYLSKENLNTRRKRRLWAHSQGKPVLTQKEIRCLSARYRHVESTYPGELVSVDTFWFNIKNLGRIYQYTACDTCSSYGWAWIYPDRTSDNTVEFLKNRILATLPKRFIKRILTDQGIEFYSARNKMRLYCLDELCKKYKIAHTLTKVAHPWTNGYAERLNQTIWEEFYLCRLTHPYGSIDELNSDLQAFMRTYNHSRRHTGYKLREGGYEYPADAFFGENKHEDLVTA
jgi:transposase InsO family protein